VPGSDRILREPAPEGGRADGGDQAAAEGLAANFGHAQAGERLLLIIT